MRKLNNDKVENYYNRVKMIGRKRDKKVCTSKNPQEMPITIESFLKSLHIMVSEDKINEAKVIPFKRYLLNNIQLIENLKKIKLRPQTRSSNRYNSRLYIQLTES